MSVSPDMSWSVLLALVAAVAYLLAAWPAVGASGGPRRWPTALLMVAGGVHGLALLADTTGAWRGVWAPRFGFAPALSGCVWMVWAVHAWESRWWPLDGVRRALAVAGALVCLLLWAFPGDMPLKASSPWMPLHLLLGVASLGLVGAAVFHAVLLDASERGLRQRPGARAVWGLPLLRLERLTFQFVNVGFVVLSAALLAGGAALALGHMAWRWDHKTVLSLLAWATLAALVWGRQRLGWRGQQATRWLYAAALLLALAYIGSRFVLEVLLQRAA